MQTYFHAYCGARKQCKIARGGFKPYMEIQIDDKDPRRYRLIAHATSSRLDDIEYHGSTVLWTEQITARLVQMRLCAPPIRVESHARSTQ